MLRGNNVFARNILWYFVLTVCIKSSNPVMVLTNFHYFRDNKNVAIQVGGLVELLGGWQSALQLSFLTQCSDNNAYFNTGPNPY